MQVFGDSCVKIHGRTYHFLSPAAGGKRTNALSYLTFGGNDEALASAAENDPKLTSRGAALYPRYIKEIFNMLTKDIDNPFYAELKMIGQGIILVSLPSNLPYSPSVCRNSKFAQFSKKSFRFR